MSNLSCQYSTDWKRLALISVLFFTQAMTASHRLSIPILEINGVFSEDYVIV
jgi:hypothetical protein